MALDIGLLGPFSLTFDGNSVPLSAWKRRKALALLKILALKPALQLHCEEAIELLWPEYDPANGRNNLDRTLYHLRRTLAAYAPPGTQALVILNDGLIRIADTLTVTVDVHRFNELVTAAATHPQPIPLLERALALYRGPLLEDDRNEEWAFGPRARLHHAYLDAVSALAEAYGRQGQSARQIELLRLLVAADQTNEHAQRALMSALWHAGRRAEAIQQYQRCCDELERELGLDPDPATVRLYEAILKGALPRDQAPAPLPPTPAPPLLGPRSPLIGRNDELATLASKLRQPDVALVTLVGPPGVGKTSLARQISQELAAEFPAGILWVSLAAIEQPEHVVPTLLQALGGQAAPPRSRRLVIVDTVEHVIAAAGELAALVRANPGLKLLATSRCSLQVSGEHVISIQPFLAPLHAALPFERIAAHPAVQLFVARAQALLPDFALSEVNAPTIAAICHRLDGLPLAVELAASHLRSLTPELLLARMERRLPLLTSGARDWPARQQTLRAAIDWSYDLLNAAERLLFARLSMFADGATFEAIEAICAPDDIPILATLDALVDKSLLYRRMGPGGRGRFVMLDTLREYAHERHAQQPQVRSMLLAHAYYYCGFAQGLVDHQKQALLLLEDEHDNLRAALRWAVANDPALALNLCTALADFWQLRGYWREGYAWLLQALAAPATAPAARGPACLAAGQLATLLQEYDAATAWLQEALDRALAHDDALAATEARHALATLWINRNQRIEEAITLLEACMSAYRLYDAREHIAKISLLLIRLARHQGYHERALDLIQQGLTYAREIENGVLIAEILHNLALISVAQDRLPEAIKIFEEALQIERSLANRPGIAQALAALGLAVLHNGDAARARSLFEEALHIRQSINDTWAVALSYDDLARADLIEGHVQTAVALLKRSIALLYPMNEQLTVSYRLDALAWACALLGQGPRAAKLAGAAEAIRAHHRKIHLPIYAAHHERMRACLAEILAPDELNAAWQNGQNLAFAQAVELALEYPEALISHASSAA